MNTTQAPRRLHALLVFPLAAVVGFTLSAAVKGAIAHFGDRGAYTEEQRPGDDAERRRSQPDRIERSGTAPAPGNGEHRPTTRIS